MIEFLAAILGGAAANQLDDGLKKFDGVGWQLISRYIVGVLTAEIFFAMMLRRMNQAAMRDSLLAFNGAFAGVGICVVVARIIKDVIK